MEELLTETEQIDRELAGGALESVCRELTSRHFQRDNPSYATGGAMFGQLSLFLRDFIPLREWVESAISRLEQIPALFA